MSTNRKEQMLQLRTAIRTDRCPEIEKTMDAFDKAKDKFEIQVACLSTASKRPDEEMLAELRKTSEYLGEFEGAVDALKEAMKEWKSGFDLWAQLWK